MIMHKSTKTEKPIQTFLCPICNQAFNRKYNMEKHIGGHSDDHVCRICCCSFITATALSKHRSDHTADELATSDQFIVTVSCVYCDKSTFTSKLELYRHIQSVHGSNEELQFKCDVCQKLFKTEQILCTHQKHHNRAKLSCATCAKTFRNQKTLIEHCRIHTGDRPFVCEHCFKAFRYQSNLNQHKLSHSNDRKFQCIKCPMLFLRAHTLREHERTHTKEKPFRCQYCQRKFAQSGVLRNHVFRMHLTCDQCGIVVGRKTELLVHLWNKCNVVAE